MKQQLTILSIGAEAIVSKIGKSVLKKRTEKNYRHPELDKKIRKLRTRSEAKILQKINHIIPVPKVMGVDEIKSEINLEYIDGKKLSQNLEKTDYKKVCVSIGKNLAKLHDNDIIHGDLTTSNMILKEKEVYFIDFGLGFHSSRVEDKAVDLHLIKQALEAKHPTVHENAFKALINGYKSSKKHKAILEQLEKVERRGRYKAQY